MFVHLTDIVFFGERIANAFLQNGFVALRIKEHGVCFLPVASGTSGFLEISFGRIGEIDVNHQTHIGLVDAHAERIGGYHHPERPVLPTFLALVLDVIV